jgi:hypothetical protein
MNLAMPNGINVEAPFDRATRPEFQPFHKHASTNRRATLESAGTLFVCLGSVQMPIWLLHAATGHYARLGFRLASAPYASPADRMGVLPINDLNDNTANQEIAYYVENNQGQIRKPPRFS